VDAGEGVHLWHRRDGHGSPIVFLHGLADDHRLWRRVAPALEDRFEVVAFDLPGHGDSDPIPPGAGIEWFADAITRGIAALGLSRPVLVGLSMGGGIAQFVAIRSPGLLRGLVLISTSPAFPPAIKERLITRAERAGREGMDGMADSAIDRWFTPPFVLDHPAELEATRAAVNAMDPVQFARASRANADRDCQDQLSTIGCPVLFVAGLDDPADSWRAGDVYRDRVPEVRVELLARLSHLIPIEAPDRLLPILNDFLDGLPAADEVTGSVRGS
jgi:3-oxoadipate enol-lactonase